MERAKCKSFLSSMLAVQSALEKGERDEDHTKIHSSHHCCRYRAFRILGKGGRPVRDSHSQKHIFWIRKVSLHVSLFPTAVGKAQE